MNKLFSLKLLSKLPKSINTQQSQSQSHYFRHFHSITKTPSNPISQPKNTPFSSPYSTLFSQAHHQWRSSKIHGFFSNPVLAKHFVTTAHLRGSIKNIVGLKVAFFRAQLPKFKPSFQHNSWSSWSRGLSADNVVFGLIIANAAVFILWRVMDRGFMYRNFTISLDNLRSGRVHTLITSAFSHVDMGHILSNMIGLYFFGNNIGRVFGPEYLLKLYFAGALVGSIFYVVHKAYLAQTSKQQGMFGMHPSKIPGLGASGAVNAIMLLDIFLFPKATLYFEFFIPVPAILLGIFLIGKDVLRMVEGDSQVSGSAHLGGATVAALAWLKARRGIRF